MNKNNIKALFPEGVETITISKNDYDRLYGEMTYKNIELQNRIDKAIDYIEEKGRLKYKPYELIDILEGKDKEE